MGDDLNLGPVNKRSYNLPRHPGYIYERDRHITAVIRHLFPGTKQVPRAEVKGNAINVLDYVDPSFTDDEEYQDLIDAAAEEAQDNGLDLLYGLLTSDTAEE